MVRALCLQLGLGLGLGPGNGIISVFFCFFSLCVKVTKTCVLLSWHVAVQRSDVRPTIRDVMMMYSQDRYMKNRESLYSPMLKDGSYRSRDFKLRHRERCVRERPGRD